MLAFNLRCRLLLGMLLASATGCATLGHKQSAPSPAVVALIPSAQPPAKRFTLAARTQGALQNVKLAAKSMSVSLREVSTSTAGVVLPLLDLSEEFNPVGNVGSRVQ